MRHTRNANPFVPEFTPVPRQSRTDGWTAARQRAFIAELAATGSVLAAVSRVGMSKTGAYALHAAPGGGQLRGFA